LEAWSKLENLTLIHEPKLLHFFNNRRWKKSLQPRSYLFVSNNIAQQNSKYILLYDVFIDLTAAYNTVNYILYILLLDKVYKITKDYHLTKVIELIDRNRRFYVKLG